MVAVKTRARCGAILVVMIATFRGRCGRAAGWDQHAAPDGKRWLEQPAHHGPPPQGLSMRRRAFLGGGAAAVAGLAGGPALLDRRDERQGRELDASAVLGHRANGSGNCG
jgi:hypothetical protein